jgi:hypothetical protein
VAISRREFVEGCVGAAIIPWFPNINLDDTDAKVKRIADKYSDQYGSPGISISVARQGRTLYSYAAGFRDLVRPNEIRVTDQVAIGAISRVVCAYIAGQIVREDELLHWNTEFQKLCPELSTGLSTPSASATLEQLITHTSGLIYAVPNQDSVAKLESPVQARQELCKLSLAAPGCVSPGTRMAYSTSSNLIVVMLEKIANKPYEQLISQYINQDLGFKSIRLGMESYDEKVSPFPRGHFIDKATRQLISYGPYSAWSNNMRYRCDANIAITGNSLELAQLIGTMAGFGKSPSVGVLADSHMPPFQSSPYTKGGFSKSSVGLFHYGSAGLGEWCSAYVLKASKTTVFIYMNCNYQEGGFKGTDLVNELNELFGK